MTSGIYKIYFRDTPNKVYIGSSKHCEERKKQHLYYLRKGKHINPLLQYAFNKHLEETLIFEIIEEVESEMLILQERYWYAKSLDDGLQVYNVIIPDNHPVNTGRTWLKKGNIPWSKGKTKKDFPEQFKNVGKKKGQGLGVKRPYFSEEWRKKISESNIGKKAWNKGLKGVVKQSQETIAKRVAKLRGQKRIITDEWRKNMSLSHIGYIMPESQKIKISLANKGRKKNKTITNNFKDVC